MYVDRDSMVDMMYFMDSAIYVYYNHYQANGPTEDLCRVARDTNYLASNAIFSDFV